MNFHLRFLKMKRQIRIGFIFSLIGLALLAFQNCAPGQQCSLQNPCATSSSSTSPVAESSSAGSSSGSSFGSSNGSSFGASSGFAPGSTSSVNTGSGFGGSSVGTSTPITSGTGTSSASGGALRITSQPQAQSVTIGQNFTLNVSVTGGTQPYTYQWYQNNVAITGMNFYLYTNTAEGFADDGAYYVTVTDANKTTIASVAVQVTVNDAVAGCVAGTYFTYTNATVDIDDYIENYFAGPAGKFLISSALPYASTILSFPASYSGLVEWTFPAMSYHQPTTIACTSNVPRIHTPANNPYGGGLANNAYYQYEGSVNFECQNNKLLFVSDTCHWVEVSAPPTDTGFSGHDDGGGPN